MQRVWLLGWLCVFFRLAGAQTDADPKQQIVSFREPAQRVQQILRTLSTRTQTRLVASHEVKDEIVLIDAERLTLLQLMDGLARALDAEWRQQPDGSYRLHRTVAQAQRRRALENQTLIRRWREDQRRSTPANLQSPLSEADARAALQRIRETLQEAQNHPEQEIYEVATAENFYKPLRVFNPVERLLLRLLQQMDWTEFVQIPVGEQRTYSTRPGAYAKPFKTPIAPLIQQFMQEVALLQRLERDYDLAELRRLYEQVGGYQSDEYFPNLKPFQSHGIASLHLTAKRTRPQRLVVYLYLVSHGSQARPHILSTIGSCDLRLDALVLPESLEWRSKPITWSELSRRMMPLLDWWAAPLSAEQLQELNPARVEPLSLIATDILRAYAAARQQPLIALIPDSAADPRRYGRIRRLRESMRIGEMEQYLAQWEWIEGPILTAKPRLASYYWNRRYSREGLERVIQQARRRGCVDWDDYVALAQVVPCEEAGDGCYWWLQANGVDVYYDIEAVSVLQALPPLVWSRLLQGETVPLHELPPASVAALHHALYTQCAGMVSAGNSDESSLLEVAVCYPGGLPHDMRLRLDKHIQLGVFTENWYGIWRSFTSYEEAEYEARLDLSEITDPTVRSHWIHIQQNLNGEVQHGRVIDVFLKLIPANPDDYTIYSWLSPRCELVGKPARLSEPPEALKAELEQQRKRNEP